MHLLLAEPASVSIEHHAVVSQSVSTEFRQPLQEQSNLEMSGILVQLGHIQRT